MDAGAGRIAEVWRTTFLFSSDNGSGARGPRQRLDPLIHGDELILGGAAHGADPLRGQFCKWGAGRDAVVRVTLGGIVNITTNLALIFLHGGLLSQGGATRLSLRIRAGAAAKDSR